MAMSLSKMFALERKVSAALSGTKINNYLLFWYVAKRHKCATPFLMFCKHFASFFNLVGSSSKKSLQCGIIYILSSKHFNIQTLITVSQRKRRRRRRRILLVLPHSWYPHHMFTSTACKFTVL